MINLRTKQAAMFGLDARIALAIFGALSVISGAALYSAIQNAKVTALVTEMNEVGKAWEQYYLDTGKIPAYQATDTATNFFYITTMEDLIKDPSIKGWSGPYLSYDMVNSYLAHPEYYSIALLTLNTDDGWSFWPDGKCLATETCAIWIIIDGIKSQNIVDGLDAKIDNSDGQDKGNFRWYGSAESATYFHRAILKYAPIKNPHN